MSRGIAQVKLEVCDLRKAFAGYLKANNPKNKESGILTGDRVHNPAGNKHAETMLKSLGRCWPNQHRLPTKQAAWM